MPEPSLTSPSWVVGYNEVRDNEVGDNEDNEEVDVGDNEEVDVEDDEEHDQGGADVVIHA